jgi:hypothetical protein
MLGGGPQSPVKRLLHVLHPETSLTADRHWIVAQFTSLLNTFRAHVILACKVSPGTPDCCLQSVLPHTRRDALVARHGSLYSILNSWLLCTETREMPEKRHK